MNETFIPILPFTKLPLGCLAIAALLTAGCGGQPGESAGPDGTNSPAGPGSLGPHLAVNADGNAVMSWLEPTTDDSHAVKFSVLREDAWSEPVQVAEDDGWFVNWADFPSVIPITDDRWAAHWLAKRPGGTYSYDVAISLSGDGGGTWNPALTPHDDGTPTEHGFVSMFPWADEIGAIWLDGRNMQPDPGGGADAESDREYGGMTLRFARLSHDGEVRHGGEIDNLVCDCCQTDVAVTASGPIVAFRDRSSEEIRDISVSRFAEDGWSEPVTISDDNWFIPACPVNGPAIAGADDMAIVAWYAAPKRDPRVKVAWSEDGGRTFAAPIVIDRENVSGRVDVAMLADGSAAVSWVGKTEDGGAELRVRRVSADGELGPVRSVLSGAYARNAGFPQMVSSGDRLVFAWPEPGDTRQVMTGLMPVQDL